MDGAVNAVTSPSYLLPNGIEQPGVRRQEGENIIGLEPVEDGRPGSDVDAASNLTSAELKQPSQGAGESQQPGSTPPASVDFLLSVKPSAIPPVISGHNINAAFDGVATNLIKPKFDSSIQDMSKAKAGRFGRHVASSEERKASRLDGPPDGTLTALCWGWGGEYRLGTGRDGQEVCPRHVHPKFKVGRRSTPARPRTSGSNARQVTVLRSRKWRGLLMLDLGGDIPTQIVMRVAHATPVKRGCPFRCRALWTLCRSVGSSSIWRLASGTHCLCQMTASCFRSEKGCSGNWAPLAPSLTMVCLGRCRGSRRR